MKKNECLSRTGVKMEKRPKKKIFLQGAAEAFSPKFLCEKSCREYILRALHPRGAHCPRCSAPLASEAGLQNFWQGRRCQCATCGYRFTALIATLFSGTHLDYRQILLIMALLNLGRNLSRTFIARTVGVSEATVSRIKDKIEFLKRMNPSHDGGT